MVTRAPQATEIDAAVDDSVRHARETFNGKGARVLYVVSMFPCWSETFIVREIHALLRRGSDVRIVSLRRGAEAFVQKDAQELMERVLYPSPWYRNIIGLLKRLLTQPAVTVAQPATIVARLWRKPVVMAKSLVAWFRSIGLLDEIEAYDPDHIHAHWATYASTAALAVSRHTGRPFSFTAHAHDIYLDDQLMREKLASASFVATISRFNREYLRRRYPEASSTRIEIVHCGVSRRPRGDSSGGLREKLIVSVGRLDEIKGFPSLLQACRVLKDEGANFRCEIIGDGPQRAMLRARIAQLDIGDRVVMLGARPSQEVDRKLAEADVFVLASQRSRQGNMDGIPVALMEAMAAGTPVVSTAVSGIPELVEDGRTGLLVPPRDADALARAIHRMLDDETLRARCIEGAVRKVTNEFDAEIEGERLLGIIQSVPGEVHAKTIADNH